MKTGSKPENRNSPRENASAVAKLWRDEKNTKKGGLNSGVRGIRRNPPTGLLLFLVFSVFRGFPPLSPCPTRSSSNLHRRPAAVLSVKPITQKEPNHENRLQS